MVDRAVRPMHVRDLERVLAWRNHPDIRSYMYTAHIISVDEHKDWFESASADPHKHLLIYEQNGLPVGFSSITELGASGVADWGFYLSPEAPKGAGTGLGVAVLNYAFDRLRLHKICGQALEYNERSVRFHNRLGFRREGVLREQHFDGQKRHSVLCFGLLSYEWSEAKKEWE